MIAQASASATNSSAFWIVIAVIVVFAAIVFTVVYRTQRTQRLRRRFGPEYDREVRTLKSQSKAEAELIEREQRHRKLHIGSLSPEARDRYLEEWTALQSRFVDDPGSAIRDADRIIQNVMRDRGYPADDFARTTEDLSVEHAGLLDKYRMAHRVSVASANGEATTEEMRQAVIAYRDLFERLVAASPTGDAEIVRERS